MSKGTDSSTIALSAVTVDQRCYDRDLDAYLVCGTVKHGRGLKKAVTGWLPRHDAPPELVECSFFPDLASARKQYLDLVKKPEKPEDDASLLQRDWQKAAVYAWEEDNIIPLGHTLTQDEARRLVRRVSRDYRIAAPKLIWQAHTERSEYDVDENTIYFGARDNISLLHELAHAVHAQRLDKEETPGHAPGFVWAAAELYNRYAGIDLGVIISSASRAKLLGDMDADQLEALTLAANNQNARKPAGKRAPHP